MEDSNRYMRETNASGGNTQAPAQDKELQITLGKRLTIRDYPIPCNPSPDAIEEYGRSGRCDLSYSENPELPADRAITAEEAIERCERPRMLIGAANTRTYIPGDTHEECVKEFAAPHRSQKHKRKHRIRAQG